ncbi:MAG: BON domain-containing protein [Isosphaeraceae bacterium]
MKKRTRRTVASLAGLFLLIASGACRPNQTVERQTDDAGIKTSIKAKLASDVRFSTLTAVSVDVTNGVVTLAGPVHSEEEKQKIEEVSRAVKGVVNVTNNLQVEPSPSVTPAPATTSSAEMPSAAASPAAEQPVSLTPPVPVATP